MARHCIENHELDDHISKPKITNADQERITIKHNCTPWLFLSKSDVEKMAIHFGFITNK